MQRSQQLRGGIVTSASLVSASPVGFVDTVRKWKSLLSSLALGMLKSQQARAHGQKPPRMARNNG